MQIEADQVYLFINISESYDTNFQIISLVYAIIYFGHIVTNCSTNVKCCMFKYTVLQCIVCLSGLTVPLHEDIIN